MSKYARKMKLIIKEKTKKKWQWQESNRGSPGAGSPPEPYATESSHNMGKKSVHFNFETPIIMKFIN